MMVSIGIREFRANMNAILQQIQNGEIVSLLLCGSEITKLVPPDYTRIAARQALEALRQNAIVGDVLSPIDKGWNAVSES